MAKMPHLLFLENSFKFKSNLNKFSHFFIQLGDKMGGEKDEIRIRLAAEKKKELKKIAQKNQLSMNQLINKLIDRSLEKPNICTLEMKESLEEDLQQLVLASINLRIETTASEPETVSHFIKKAEHLIIRIDTLIGNYQGFIS